MRRLLLICLLLVGCVHTYGEQRIEERERLAAGSSFYVSMPESGAFAGRSYPDSAKQTALAVTQAFRRHAGRVDLSTEVLPHDAALEAALEGGYEYLVIAIIDHWEDRATEWSGKPDRISLRVAVYRAADGEVVNAARLEGTSRWATFGGDHPQELLPQPIDRYVDSLF